MTAPRNDRPHSAEERELGLSQRGITRRDFVGGVALGSGSALLGQAIPGVPGNAFTPVAKNAFDGYGGVGDYRNCNGNTWQVVESAHRIRDGFDETTLDGAATTGEAFDVVIVGAGAAGLAAAHHFNKSTSGRGRCLIIDNHPVFGGEAKQNEFMVNGYRLIGPQGSNLFYNAPEPTPMQNYTELRDIGMPREFEYGALTGTPRKLEFDISNFMFQWVADEFDSNGFFFGSEAATDYVVDRNPWANRLKNAPWPEHVRRDMLRWKYEIAPPDDEAIRRRSGMSYEFWMDSITYEEYLTGVHGLDPAVIRWVDPMVACASGFGASAASAYAAVTLMHMHGGRGRAATIDSGRNFNIEHLHGSGHTECFPDGNGGIARYFVNHLIPGSFSGSGRPEDVLVGRIRFDRLDRPGQPVRMRLGATALRVRHRQQPGQKARVEIFYEQGGRLYRLLAPEVILCTGTWSARRLVSDLPAGHREACSKFVYSPFVVANVALTNWRFLEKAGMTGCVYTHGDFGFSCNIRRPMHIGSYRPPLDPGKPTILTFYAPIYYEGLTAREQGIVGRNELLNTPYRELELRIRKQMVRLFSRFGFEPERDIAGIVTNRWGHAYVVSAPGMVVGDACNPTPGDVLRAGHGHVKFAHSDLSGFQAYARAVIEGRRAARQVLHEA